MATLAAVTNMPALALLGEDGRLERSTEPFRRWYQDREELCLASPECKRVLDGQANAAVLKLDGIAVDIAAMVDREGVRHVLLTLPTGELPSLGDAGGALLDGALDESPALVWLKDLDGRYVRANARFTTLLNTSEERLVGRTDSELPPVETVDGPRIEEREEGIEEPLQLEYMVGPYQGREALVVFRFPVGDSQGTPTLVCGVAAPSSEARVARSEAARLLRVERWSRLDAESVRAELLADWGLLPDARGRSAAAPSTPEPGPGSAEREAAVAEARAERATAVAERDTALSANETLTAELAAAQMRLAELERALKAARADGERGDAEAKLAEHAAELDRALVRERERAEELERSLALVRQRLGDDAEAARAEVQRARADADAARTEVERARADAEAARGDTEAIRGDLEKARSEADTVRTAATAEREAAVKAAAELERSLRQSQDQLAALERQQGADTTGAQLRAAEKARVAAESAVAGAIAERDEAIRARAALGGELDQERSLLAGLRESAAAAEELIRDLTGGLERERVRAAALEQAQAQAHQVEGELRKTVMRADKAEVELDVASGRAERAEADLKAAKSRAEEAEGELRLAVARADKAEAAVEQWQARVHQLEPELERSRARAHELEPELERSRARVEALEDKLDEARTRVGELEAERSLDRARIDGLQGELERAVAKAQEDESAIAELGARLEELEARLEEAQSQPPAVVAEAPASVETRAAVEVDGPPASGADPEAGLAAAGELDSVGEAPSAAELARLERPAESGANPAGGVSWQPTAKRALSASLAREAVWRNVLKETVEVLGSEGGWDTVTAWLPDESNHLGCAATWAAHRGLERFESLTWDVPVKREGSLLDQALQAPHLTWLTDLDTVDDARLQTAAAHGMNSALLLPVRNGPSTIGLLELLTHDTIEPDAQIALSLEASALQLGRFGHLLSLGKSA